MREVTGNRDLAEYGLGTPTKDETTLAQLHETLVDADWLTWARETSRSVVAIADYKGRLLYTSASAASWGADVRQLPAAARAFAGRGGDSAQVVRGDDAQLRATGVVGPPAGDALQV